VNGIIKHELSVRNGYNLAGITFETKVNTTIIRALVRGPNPPTPQQVADLESKLPATPDGTAIELRIRFSEIVIVNRNGLLFTDSYFGSGE